MNRAFVGLTVLLVLAQPALAQSVVDSDFTISVPTGSGEPVVESSTLVPLLAGTCYDWRLKLGKVKGDIAITEVYTLPSAPLVWELGDESIVAISDDRKSAISSLTLTPQDGWIANGWCVSEGDPAGEYSFEIRSGDRELRRFTFELREM